MRHRSPTMPPVLLAAGLILLLPLPAPGQSRDVGQRGGGGQAPAPRRDPSPPPAPQRDYSPPPVRRDSPPPAPRDYSPPPMRQDPAPRRDYSPPPTRDPGRPPVRDYAPPSRRDDIGSRRDPLPRREEPGTRRDEPGPRMGDRDRAPGDRGGLPRGERARDIGDRSGRDRTPPRDDTLGGRVPDVLDRSGNSRERDLYDRAPRRDSTLGSDRRGVESRTLDPRPTRDRARDLFTRSMEGRRYENGLVLRPGGYVSYPGLRPYFPHAYSYYPYYCPTFSASLVFYSPYSYYYGVCPPYIYRRHCYYRPPSYVYIEVPVYLGSVSRGYDGDLDDYYLSRSSYELDARDRESGLDRAVDALHEAFRYNSIESLVDITDPGVRIAVFRKGKYEYSLDSGDFLDMTRDAMRTTDTIQFDLYRVRRRASGVYVVSGRHIYRNRDGERRTVYVSYVLERLRGRWILTQVGTSPDRIQEP